MTLTKKLHLGAGNLEKFDPERLKKFLSLDWIHLGDPDLKNPNNRELQRVDYSKTNFIPFKYSLGDSLPINDESISFIFSEHFFEHLFLNEAISLFGECRRVLVKNGIFRVIVPDADLRPIPERLGFPDEKIGYDSPEKHKTRWSVYSLKPLLEISGFRCNPLKYYDRSGILHNQIGNLNLQFYGDGLDLSEINDFSLIKRQNSLMVDAIK